MNQSKSEVIGKPFKKRNYKPLIIALSIILIGAIGVLSGMSGVEDFDAFDVTILPLNECYLQQFYIFILGRRSYCHYKAKRKGASSLYLCSLCYDIPFSCVVRGLPLPCIIHILWWRRFPGRVLLLCVNYTYHPGSGNCSTCTYKCSPCLEYGERTS